MRGPLPERALEVGRGGGAQPPRGAREPRDKQGSAPMSDVQQPSEADAPQGIRGSPLDGRDEVGTLRHARGADVVVDELAEAAIPPHPDQEKRTEAVPRESF